ncbi:MAG: M23 family metallopeptidase [Gammaproteobacteria bacterium]|nr:M23 family metallopeptidase [Gammaproteobacteria bacterium]
MKIILLREKGRSHSIRILRRTLIVSMLCLSLLATVAGVFVFHGLTREVVDEAVVAGWQERLARQQAEVERIRDLSAAESEAVGRQLAQMQARLLRMEALGARVTEVADLEEGEFSFARPAAQGGPTSRTEDAVPWPSLLASLDELSSGLKYRENELEVLESLLRDREYRKAVAVAGRPITWGWMSSPYGRRVDPISGKSAWHAGVDFAGRDGSDVIAVASGVVTYAAKRSGYGKMVEINHGDGYVTRYGHHTEVLVSAGDIVKKGQVIGTMGSSGRSTGPHVHFEVLKNGRHVDPARYVARR